MDYTQDMSLRSGEASSAKVASAATTDESEMSKTPRDATNASNIEGKQYLRDFFFGRKSLNSLVDRSYPINYGKILAQPIYMPDEFDGERKPTFRVSEFLVFKKPSTGHDTDAFEANNQPVALEDTVAKAPRLSDTAEAADERPYLTPEEKNEKIAQPPTVNTALPSIQSQDRDEDEYYRADLASDSFGVTNNNQAYRYWENKAEVLRHQQRHGIDSNPLDTIDARPDAHDQQMETNLCEADSKHQFSDSNIDSTGPDLTDFDEDDGKVKKSGEAVNATVGPPPKPPVPTTLLDDQKKQILEVIQRIQKQSAEAQKPKTRAERRRAELAAKKNKGKGKEKVISEEQTLQSVPAETESGQQVRIFNLSNGSVGSPATLMKLADGGNDEELKKVMGLIANGAKSKKK
ncbi:hypothetical protein BDV96DRAFT_684651 [Lophiotrema nucula]|uniref:Uncharacterized protein n=1 Tax=Lophiotrema nucula TaxID=690887 RepID=A0A6A5ZLD0_9PLEO|nr:hypothetical protein BDV96DRAFT_684651 [Lophiotrema nucula]